MKKSIAIIGGGSAALAFASFIDTDKFEVTIYERNKTVGRKFLVAGDGGFNLTHSEAIEKFIERYSPSTVLKNALTSFSNLDTQAWINNLGIPTFVGSSKRVYPEAGIKPIEVLNAILSDIKSKGVQIKTGQTWTGWNEKNELVLNKKETVKADYTVFSLGGGSWSVTGSNSDWFSYYKEKEIKVTPFEASNCAFKIDWSESFLEVNGGKPLKNISVNCGGISQKGELVITKYGLEGNAIYALSPTIRNELKINKAAIANIDLKPQFTKEELLLKLENSNKKNLSETLRKDIKLSNTQVALLKSNTTKEEFNVLQLLSEKIKKLPLTIIGLADVDEAISTVGGIDLNEVTDKFELAKLKDHYCIGEMLNWDAPTGGYLLQGCFSMGVTLARTFNGI